MYWGLMKRARSPRSARRRPQVMYSMDTRSVSLRCLGICADLGRRVAFVYTSRYRGRRPWIWTRPWCSRISVVRGTFGDYICPTLFCERSLDRGRVQALPHQRVGTRFLRSKKAAALFDEQGLGKSKQLIDAISEDIAADVLDAALIVCPNTLKTTWGEEIEKYSDLRYAVFGAGKKARRETFRSLKAAFYIINYEAVSAEMPSLRALLRFKRVALVLDESHRIKTPEAKVTRAVLALRSEAVKRYIMTGTPVANKPEDLWSQLFFLDDGERLGASFEVFKR